MIKVGKLYQPGHSRTPIKPQGDTRLHSGAAAAIPFRASRQRICSDLEGLQRSTVTVDAGSAPYGTAVFSYTQNRILVSEAGLPVSPPTRAARFFVDSRTSANTGTGSGAVNISTGFAAVIQSKTDASLVLKLRDGSGTTLAQGTIRLARGAQTPKLLFFSRQCQGIEESRSHSFQMLIAE